MLMLLTYACRDASTSTQRCLPQNNSNCSPTPTCSTKVRVAWQSPDSSACRSGDCKCGLHKQVSRPSPYVLSVRRADYYGIQYKNFVTGGPDSGAVSTRGTFGIENVTGPGHIISTGAWAGTTENHNGEINCLDSWTGLSVHIPVGGLTPFPDDVASQPGWAEQVVITPISLVTLGQGSASANITDLQAKYDNAHRALGVVPVGEFSQGMINSGEWHTTATCYLLWYDTAVCVAAAELEV